VRRGLSREDVVDAAVRVADRGGPDGLTLAAVAAELGIRTPSLYNHVSGLPGLRRELALRGIRELSDRLRDAAVGRSGDDALAAIALAYRAFARERRGLYLALQAAPDPDDTERLAAAATVVELFLSVLRGYGLEDEQAIHATRFVRSSLHGFADLERVGGFGIDLAVAETHRWMVAALADGLRSRAAASA
jgi:AcrR family transcriptional regulator